jgi:hypothetical protein
MMYEIKVTAVNEFTYDGSCTDGSYFVFSPGKLRRFDCSADIIDHLLRKNLTAVRKRAGFLAMWLLLAPFCTFSIN